ncbi:MAG: histidine phosphatase family protein [Chloroflexota bacterium]
MTTIMLTRHGETEWNVGEVFRGRIDIGLNEIGLRQASLLSGYLTDINIEAIYSSPLQRAFKTAELIAQPHHLEVKAAPGLIDFSFGEWQGLHIEVVKERYPAAFQEWATRPQRVIIPGGESLSNVRKRTMTLIRKIIAQHTGTVVLVSHRAVNKVLICALLGLNNSHFWNVRQDNCGLTTFTYDNNRFVLVEHNNTCFLQSLRAAKLADF